MTRRSASELWLEFMDSIDGRVSRWELLGEFSEKREMGRREGPDRATG